MPGVISSFYLSMDEIRGRAWHFEPFWVHAIYVLNKKTTQPKSCYIHTISGLVALAAAPLHML